MNRFLFYLLFLLYLGEPCLLDPNSPVKLLWGQTDLTSPPYLPPHFIHVPNSLPSIPWEPILYKE